MINTALNMIRSISSILLIYLWIASVSAAPAVKNPSTTVHCFKGWYADTRRCWPCAAGTFQPVEISQAMSCTPCSSTTFAPSTESVTCNPCDFTIPGSNSCNSITGLVNHCNPGWGLNLSSPKPSCINCQALFPNTWSTGATGCLPCKCGPSQTCALGTGVCTAQPKKKMT